MVEQWRPVVGWEGLYEVSDMGRVRSTDSIVDERDRWGGVRSRAVKGRILSTTPVKRHGYPRLTLSRNGRRRPVKVATLVAEAFIGPRPAGMEVCHWDGDRVNSRLCNLRYDTPRANRMDSIRHGTWANQNTDKEWCPRRHLLAWPNLTKSGVAAGRRRCLACLRANSVIHRRHQRGQVVPDMRTLSDEKYAEIMGTGDVPS